MLVDARRRDSMVWPQHSLQPNLLTLCVLERAKLPQSVLRQLYVRVAADPIVSEPTKAPVRPETSIAAGASRHVTRVADGAEEVEAISHPPAASDASGKITSVDAIMKLGLVALEKELQRRGLKTGGTLLQRAERLAAVGGIRAPAPHVPPTPDTPPPDATDAPHVPPPQPEASNAERRKAAKRLRQGEEPPAPMAPKKAPRGADTGSGGPALRAPDPTSRRSRLKASGEGRPWYGEGRKGGGKGGGKAGGKGRGKGGGKMGR